VISSFFSFFLVRDTVSNNRLQLEHICTVLELNSNIQNVHIIEPPNDQLIGYSGKRVINDEFNMISRAYPLMIRTCLASDPGARKWELRRRMPTVTRSISTNSLIFAPKNSQFIDLSIPLKIESIRNFPVASVQASSFAYSSDVYGGDFPTNLFDDRHDTFWQTTFGFPQTMQIDFPKEIMLKAYSLKIMDNPDLAPLDWVLLTSLDGKNFIQVDKREGINYWKSYQEITFELNKVIKFKSLRLIINKGLGTYLKIDSLKIFAK
jgi:hypothetical protein